MLKKSVTLVALIPLLAACDLPKGLKKEDVLAYEAAVASVGCVMRVESDYLPVELQTGFTREQVVGLTEYELAKGNAVKLDDGGVKLTTGACA